MQPLLNALPFTLAALLAVTFLCTVGSIASRRLKFNFMYLSLFSFFIYIAIGYFVSSKANLSTAILSSLIVGFFDATVGWKLSILLKANMPVEDEVLKEMTPSKGLTIMLFVAPFFAFIGHLFV